MEIDEHQLEMRQRVMKEEKHEGQKKEESNLYRLSFVIVSMLQNSQNN